MSGAFLKSLFGDCKVCSRVHYGDTSFLKRHYRQKHDYQELLKKADSIGLIDDLTKYHSIGFVATTLAGYASTN